MSTVMPFIFWPYTGVPPKLDIMAIPRKTKAFSGGSAAANLTRAQKDALLKLVMDPLGDPRFRGGPYAPIERPVRRLPLAKPPVTPLQFQIRVDLVGAQPPLWRRLAMPSNLTLDRVHEVLQLAFEWTDDHLHRFAVASGRKMSRTEPILSTSDDPGNGGVSESELRLDQLLAKVGDSLFYTYDFGDDWRHVLKLEAVETLPTSDPGVRCISGRRRGAPEDVGGIYFYDELLAAATDPDHPDREQFAERIDDFELWDFEDHIDLALINARLP